MSLRVDMICGSYPPDVCGVSDYTRRLVRELRLLGLDVRLVTTVGLDTDVDPEIPAAGECSDWSASGALALARCLRRRGPEVVHIQFPSFRYHGKWGIHLLPLYLRMRGIPVVTTLHEYCMAPWGGRAKQMFNVMLSNRVIVTNEEDRRLLGHWISPERLELVRIGSNIEPVGNVERGRALLSAIGVRLERPVLLFFGFVRPGKGVETLLEAVSSGGRPFSSQIVIVCPDPEPAYREHLLQLCGRLGISGSVFWTGYLDESDVSSVLMACTAAVLPFEDGATARRGSLLAALVHALPVVTTSSSRTPEEFRHGTNMMLSNVGDAGALASNVRHLLQEEALRANISHGAAELAVEFDWRRIAVGNIAVYEAVLRHGRG